MVTKTMITDINHEDLIDFFSTALYGSSFFGVEYNTKDYEKCSDKHSGDCMEDKLARILLNGGSIVIYDCEAEDEEDYYGELPHCWDSDNYTMDYTITLEDLKKGFQKCLDGTFNVNKGCDEEIPYMKKCMNDLINHEEGNLDLPEAENILQICIFGELIYG